MISIPVAVMFAALSALLAGAVIWGRSAEKIDAMAESMKALTLSLARMSEKFSALALEVERLKWHTGAHRAAVRIEATEEG